MGSIGNGENSASPDYMAEWKANEVTRVVEEMDKWRVKQQEWKETKTFRERMMLENNVPKVYLSAIKANYASEESKNNRFNMVATELVDAHFEALKDKVEKNIGKITRIVRTGNANDYVITGESGDTVHIQVVMAGGYNKQRLHTRWVQNKLGSRRKNNG